MTRSSTLLGGHVRYIKSWARDNVFLSSRQRQCDNALVTRKNIIHTRAPNPIYVQRCPALLTGSTQKQGQYFLYLKRQCNETVWTFFFIESNSTQNLTLSKDSIDTAKNLHQTFNIVAKMSILKLKFKPELPLGRDSLNSP